MSNREMEITRFSEDIMTQQEKDIFLSEVHADAELREELETEETIRQILRADAQAVEENEVFDTIPGAPLIQRLEATAISARSKGIYYIAGAIALIAVLLFLLFSMKPEPKDSVKEPVLQKNPQSAPLITPPEKTSNIVTQPEKIQIKTGQNKEHNEMPLPVKKQIDLDQDLKDKPIKEFTDPKGHMPIKN